MEHVSDDSSRELRDGLAHGSVTVTLVRASEGLLIIFAIYFTIICCSC